MQTATIFNRMVLPVATEDPKADYEALTQRVALWDVGCERQVQVQGPDALKLCQYLSARDLSQLKIGVAKYVPLCDHKGRLINDPIALRVDDLEEATNVMRECLGFEVSDIVKHRDVFLYCNTREHTALIRPYTGEGKRIDHLRIELDSLDDVGFTLDRASEQVPTAHSSLGKNTTSQSISFYMDTPSNFPIQYGWGSGEISPKNRRVLRHDRSMAWGHYGL